MKIPLFGKKVFSAKSASIVASTVALATAVLVATAETAKTTDYVLVVSGSKTLPQALESEFHSTKYVEQIATYNGLDSLTDVLPNGTRVQIPEPYIQERKFGRVVFAKGDVVHTQERLVVNPPAKGSHFYAGDVFSTGDDGFVSLNFNSGSVVNLQPDSRVTIADIDCIDADVKCVIALNADKGEVQSEVTPRPFGQPAVEFTVKTPFLSAAVRGTAFYVNVDSGADRIGVTHGMVATQAGSAANDLPEGKGLLAKPGVNPTVVDLLTPPDLAIGDGPLLYSSEDNFGWAALANAQNYRVTVADDESMMQPLMVARTETNSAALPVEITPGEYYLAVAGIDDQQFLGLPAMAKFTYATIDEEKPELLIERRNRMVDVSLVEYSGPVELLIGNSIDGAAVERKIVDNLSEGMTLDLDPQQDWVIKARKVLSGDSVSYYSNQYLLEALK